MVPWPVISPTFPRKASKLLTQAARPSHFSPTPPLPRLYPGSSPHLNHHSSSSSHFICHFFTFSLHSVISSFDPCHRLSHLHFIHYLSRLLCFNISPSPSLRFRVLGLPTARSCCRPRANPSALTKDLDARTIRILSQHR